MTAPFNTQSNQQRTLGRAIADQRYREQPARPTAEQKQAEKEELDNLVAQFIANGGKVVRYD